MASRSAPCTSEVVGLLLHVVALASDWLACSAHHVEDPHGGARLSLCFPGREGLPRAVRLDHGRPLVVPQLLLLVQRGALPIGDRVPPTRGPPRRPPRDGRRAPPGHLGYRSTGPPRALHRATGSSPGPGQGVDQPTNHPERVDIRQSPIDRFRSCRSLQQDCDASVIEQRHAHGLPAMRAFLVEAPHSRRGFS